MDLFAIIGVLLGLALGYFGGYGRGHNSAVNSFKSTAEIRVTRADLEDLIAFQLSATRADFVDNDILKRNYNIKEKNRVKSNA